MHMSKLHRNFASLESEDESEIWRSKAEKDSALKENNRNWKIIEMVQASQGNTF